MPEPFKHRHQAGQMLARRLQHYAGRNDVIVLALPRGGVPVGFEIAQTLNAPLDVFMVRKLGVPGHEELQNKTGQVRLSQNKTGQVRLSGKTKREVRLSDKRRQTGQVQLTPPNPTLPARPPHFSPFLGRPASR